MEYRRRYYRRFANQNQEEKPQNNLDQNQKEEKVEPPKNEAKVNEQNGYLQKLLQKTNNVQNPQTISLNTVQESLPSFKNNIHDILSTDENKQRAIKYVIHKRNEVKKGKLQINTENEQEESNPVLANRYSHYRGRNFINNNNQKGEIFNKNTNVNLNNKNEKEKEEMRQEIKTNFLHHYVQRTNPMNANKDQTGQVENNNENNYRGRKIQVSISSNNILKSPRNLQPFEKDEKVVVKKERYYNIGSYRNNNANMIKETEEEKPRYKYFRGYVKKFEGEQKEKENILEKEKEKEIQDNQPKEINISLNVGKNFSFGVKDILSNKSFGNQSSGEILNLDEINKFRGYKYFKIVKNNFELGKKYKKDVYSKKFGFNRLKDKNTDKTKEIVKDKVIDFKLLGNNMSNEKVITNTEAPPSRFRRKYGRFSSNLENNNSQNLAFKDENELIAYLNKKYNQEKIIELFKIKPLEEQKNKKEANISQVAIPDTKELQEQLNEEKRKNEEYEKKLKQLETNIGEQTNEIRDKNIGIGKKIQEIDKLKNDITSYKKELQAKEKENTRIKNELDQNIKIEGNKQNRLKEELDRTKTNYNNLIKENEKNIKDYNELNKQNDKNKKDLNELLKKYELLKNKNEELSDIKKSKEELDINYNSIKEENTNLKNENDSIKNELNITKEELETFQKDNQKIKGEMSITNNLNDKLLEDNGKLKEEIQNINSELEKNKQQIQDLSKTKDKYYKLLDDYKQLTRDCNILRDEKTSIQIEQKQAMHNYKNSQEEYSKLKNDYDKLIEELNAIKIKDKAPKSILKKNENKTIDIETEEKEININKNPNSKTIIIENIERETINLNDNKNKEDSNDSQKVADINNVISDVNNNINDLINKINSSDSNASSAKKEFKDSSVKFNIQENQINDESEKNKIDEEKKNLRLSKAMQRIKKKQENNNNENNSQLKINKSIKVQDLVKELENNMQKRDIIEGEKEEQNGGTEVQIENGANIVNVLDNQQLTKSMKKKKKAKQFNDD